MKKSITLFFLYGVVFSVVEYVFRCISFDVHTFSPNLLIMHPIGGLCILIIGYLNEVEFINNNVNIFWQSIGSCAIITTIEYFSGLLVNVVLGMQVWDYTKYWLNLNGQICLMMSFVWLLLSPFGFWLDDVVRWYQSGETRRPPYSLLEIYKRAINPCDKPFI